MKKREWSSPIAIARPPPHVHVRACMRACVPACLLACVTFTSDGSRDPRVRVRVRVRACVCVRV